MRTRLVRPADRAAVARRWWLLLDAGKTELCTEFPGRAADVTLTSSLRTLAKVFNGDMTLQAALAAG